MKIIALIGSIRKDSYNRQLVHTMQERYKEEITIEIADIGKLPHFNQDEETNPSIEVISFKKQIADADGILIATPEYNWSVPGVLKNALDWMSRGDKVLVNKPVLVVGVSTGMLGTIRAQMNLRLILESPGVAARVLRPAGNEIVINLAAQKFESGRLIDKPTLELLDNVVKKYTDWI